jgi:hypothetical protein
VANLRAAKPHVASRKYPTTAGGADDQAAQTPAVKRYARRGRPAQIDPELTRLVADGLERILRAGFDLVRTHRSGWSLRQWDTWIDSAGAPRSGWHAVDSAPEGELAALLLRHQRVTRGI